MKIIEKLFHPRKSSPKEDGLRQQEREAIIDLLLLGIYVDNHLSLVEDQLISEEVEKFNWEGNRDVSGYLSDAMLRARDAGGNSEATDHYLKFVSERLGSRSARSVALDLLHKVFTSDGKSLQENEFYKKVESHLKQ